MSELAQLQERKAGGAEWIGSVPNSWTLRPFFSVARQSRRSNKGLVEKNLLSLSYGRIINKNIDANEGLLPESFETYQIVEPDDMIFRLTDLQNDQQSLRTGLVTERGIITSAYLCVAPKGINPRFFAHTMRAADHRKVFYSRGDGLRQTLKYDDLKWLWIPFPPLSDQQKVVDFVDRETAKIDAVIEKQRALVNGLHEHRKSVIRRAVTGEAVGDEGGWVSNGRAWTGRHPMGWRTEKIAWLFNLIGSGTTPSAEDIGEMEEGRIPWVNTSELRESRIADVIRGLPKDVVQNHSALRIYPAGTILFAMYGATIGRMGMLDIPASVNQACLALAKPREDVHSKFVYYALQAARDYIVRLASGGGQPNVNQEKVKSVCIPLSNYNDQLMISSHLDKETARIDSLIAKSERLIELSQERRAALITAAVTGQIDITSTTDTRTLDGAA